MVLAATPAWPACTALMRSCSIFFQTLPASQSLPGQVVAFSGNSLWPMTFCSGMLSFCISQATRLAHLLDLLRAWAWRR